MKDPLALPPGYYETVKGINWISGWACQRLLENGPTPIFYMGLRAKPGIIYDVAYSPEEALKIGQTVIQGMKLKNTQDVSFGFLSENTAKSLYYIVQKHYSNVSHGQLCKIEIPLTPGHDKTFEQWCIDVKGRVAKDVEEKKEWFTHWKACGN